MHEFAARHYRAGSADASRVTLRLNRGSVEVERDDEQPVIISLSDMDLDVAGSFNNRVVLKHTTSGDHYISEDRKLLQALKEQNVARLKAEADRVDSKMKREPIHNLSAWGALLVALLATGIIVYITLDAMVSMIAARIPPDLEVKVGEMVLDSYKRDHTFVSSGPQLERVKQIGDRLVKALDNPPYKFHFYLEPSKQINAFAVPGGNIVVLSKLVESAENDSEIAGVLAHEIGHVTKRHSLKAALRHAGWLACLKILLGGMERNASQMVGYFVNLEQLGYSRSQETEADLTGIKLADRAGYSPGAIIKLFERLKRDMPVTDTKAMEFVSNHPMPSERIKMIESEIARMKKEDERAKDIKGAPAGKRIGSTDRQTKGEQHGSTAR